MAQLQRLPGLTQRDQEAGSRSFVDQDMLAALQGGALARVIWGQYSNIGPAPLSAISSKSVSMASYLLRRNGATSSTPFSIVERLSNEAKTPANFQLIADCFAVSAEMAKEEEHVLDCYGIVIESALFQRLDLEDCNFRKVTFLNCLIDEVSVGALSVDFDITFRNCIINRIGGVANEMGLPEKLFEKSCEVVEFDNMGTTSAVLQSDLEPQVKALLTILRKLYRQSGAGRKILAFSRGITKNDVADYIPPVLNLMEKHGFVRIFNQVVHPVRKNANRVEKILNAPSVSKDELLLAVKAL